MTTMRPMINLGIVTPSQTSQVIPFQASTIPVDNTPAPSTSTGGIDLSSIMTMMIIVMIIVMMMKAMSGVFQKSY